MEEVSMRGEGRGASAKNAVDVVRALVGPAAWERHGGKWMHRANTDPERVCAAILLLPGQGDQNTVLRDVEAYLERCWISADGRLHRFKRR